MMKEGLMVYIESELCLEKWLEGKNSQVRNAVKVQESIKIFNSRDPTSLIEQMVSRNRRTKSQAEVKLEILNAKPISILQKTRYSKQVYFISCFLWILLLSMTQNWQKAIKQTLIFNNYCSDKTLKILHTLSHL